MIGKGIVLVGGTGSRLWPLTRVVSKQLLPVYDQPMVHYPLATLMRAGIRDLLLVTTPHDQPLFQALLGDGGQWGIAIRYASQARPDGLVDAFRLGRGFLAGQGCALILGDNLFLGAGLDAQLREAGAQRDGATVFGRVVEQPGAYAVAEFAADGALRGIEEKPARPSSACALTGLYVYDASALDKAERLARSARGEYEITDLNRLYLDEGALRLQRLAADCAWFNAGTPQALLEAGACAAALEGSTGRKSACPEEVAWRQGWITSAQLAGLAAALSRSAYGRYLAALAAGGAP